MLHAEASAVTTPPYSRPHTSPTLKGLNTKTNIEISMVDGLRIARAYGCKPIFRADCFGAKTIMEKRY
jgi:hypothetical protein